MAFRKVELPMQSLSGVLVCLRRFFCAIKISKMDADRGGPSIVPLVELRPPTSLMQRFGFGLGVVLVLRRSDRAQVDNPVVGSVAVDVVNLAIGPGPIMQRPCDAMGRNSNAEDYAGKVSPAIWGIESELPGKSSVPSVAVPQGARP